MSQYDPEMYEAEFHAYGPRSSVAWVGAAYLLERAPAGLHPDTAYETELISVGQLGALVKERRGSMTQKSLAAVAHIKQPTISDIEQGSPPSVRIADQLYRSLGGNSLYLAIADIGQIAEPRFLSVVGTQDYGPATGILLREARTGRNMTQRGLADLIGKPQSQISAVECAWDDGSPFTTRVSSLPQYFEPLGFWVGYCGIKDRAAAGR